MLRLDSSVCTVLLEIAARSKTWGPCLSFRASVTPVLLCWLLIFATLCLKIKCNKHLYECLKHS